MSRRRTYPRLAWLAALAAGTGAHASPEVELGRISDQAQTTQASGDKPKSKKAEVLVVPIPMSSPALGSGVTLAAVVFYNPNDAPQPWISGGGALRTSNKSQAFVAFHTMSLAHDRFRVLALGGYADVNLKFYGIGAGAGDRDQFVKINDRGYAAIIQGQMRIVKNLYLGARYMGVKLNSGISLPDPLFPDLNLPKAQLKSQISAFGPVMTYDRRDSSTNPSDGAFVVMYYLKNSKSFGSDFNYEKFQIQANVYRRLGPGTVIAGRGLLCAISTGGPYYDLCNYGSRADLRGYEAGRYRDRASWAVQAELRQHLFWRLGAVAFAGYGGTAPSLDRIGDFKKLPAAGGGLRFLASKQNNVNLRLDYAWGKHSKALYFGIGEAF
jgi:outer membrane protein assembly factor BamA